MGNSRIMLTEADFAETTDYLWPVEDDKLEYFNIYRGSRANLRRNLAGRLPGAVKGRPVLGSGYATFDNANNSIQLPARPYTVGTFFLGFRAPGTPQTRYGLTALSGGVGPALYINGSNQLIGAMIRNPSTPGNDPVTITTALANDKFYFASFAFDTASQMLVNHTTGESLTETGSLAPVEQVAALRVGAAIGDSSTRLIDIVAAGWSRTVYDDAMKAAVYQRVKDTLSLDGSVI